MKHNTLSNTEVKQLLEQYKGLMKYCVHKWNGALYTDAELHSIAQDSLILAYQTHKPGTATFSTFAIRVILGRLRDAWRAENRHWKRKAELIDSDHIDTSTAEAWDIQIDVERQLSKLSSKDRYIISSRWLEGKTLQEIANELKVTNEAVSHQEQQILKYLKKNTYSLVNKPRRTCKRVNDKFEEVKKNG